MSIEGPFNNHPIDPPSRPSPPQQSSPSTQRAPKQSNHASYNNYPRPSSTKPSSSTKPPSPQFAPDAPAATVISLLHNVANAVSSAFAFGVLLCAVIIAIPFIAFLVALNFTLAFVFFGLPVLMILHALTSVICGGQVPDWLACIEVAVVAIPILIMSIVMATEELEVKELIGHFKATFAPKD